MRHSTAYPVPLRIYPRRSRRGFAALSMVMVFTVLMTATILSWQIGLARDRIDGYARALAVAVDAEGYALHHWWHGYWHTMYPDPQPNDLIIDARDLNTTERGAFTTHGAVQGWRRLNTNPVEPLRGWTITHRLDAPITEGTPGRAVVRLNPDLDMLDEPYWPALRAALDLHLPGTFPVGCTTPATCFMDMDAYHLARIDTEGVLRMRRSGFATSVMATDLDMADNNIDLACVTLPGEPPCDSAVDSGSIETDRLEADVLQPVDPGENVDVNGDLRAVTLRVSGADGEFTSASALRVSGDGDDTTPAATFATVTVNAGQDGVTQPKILACRTPEEDGCGDSGTDAGGTLDLTGGQGTPDWSDGLALFGDGRIDQIEVDATGTITDNAVFDAVTDTTGRLEVERDFRCAECRWLYQ